MAQSAPHCHECVSGYTDAGKPSGSDFLLDGTIKCYVAKSPIETDKAVMIITDVFGHTVVNVRLIADRIAAKGFTVYVPDLQAGDCLEPEVWSPILLEDPEADMCNKVWNGTRFFASMPSLISWLGRHGEKQTLPIIDTAIDAIIGLGAKKLGVQGFCWGGKYSTLLGASDKVDAIVVAHPSGLVMPKNIVDIKHPALFICAETDFTFSSANVDETKKILLAKSADNVVKVYTGVKHGFAVRGNEKDSVVCAARNDALEMATDFFLKHLV